MSALCTGGTGTEVIVLSVTNSSWFEVSCPDDKRGYMASQYLTYGRTDATPELAARTSSTPGNSGISCSAFTAWCRN